MKGIIRLTSLVGSILISLFFAGCEGKKDTLAIRESSTAGFNAILFNIHGTTIKGGSSDSIEQIRKRFESVNLNGTDSIWPAHEKFFMHAMGNLEFAEAGNYTLRVTSSGKIVFRLNNVDVLQTKNPIDTIAAQSRYVEAGKNIFEFEYYDGGLPPKIILEWSKDGTNFEIVPPSAYSVIDQSKDSLTTASVDNSNATELNTLTTQEKAEGWKLLFDGKTTAGWHRYNSPGAIGSKWHAEDGALTFDGRNRFRYFIEGRMIEMGDTHKKEDGGVDIVTDQSFGDFELALEWKISQGGNSGIFYTVMEDPKYDEEWKTSPEMQVLDNNGHKDGLIYKHRSGDLYDLIACNPVTVKPQGSWNQVRVVKRKGMVEHWLNGVKVVEYNINSEEWSKMIQTSKFKDLKDFATSKVNKIGLQDHDNKVWFRNIKIKELK